jgi:hypothetical protein
MNCKRLYVLLIVSLGAHRMACAQSDTPPTQLIRLAVQNELAADRGTGENFMFCDHKQTQHGSETKALVETHIATAGLVVARNGQPLAPAEARAEQGREQRFVTSSSELQAKVHREQEDRDHTIQIMKAFPDAFLYEPAGTQAGTDDVGKLGDELVRLNFHPNPKYVPPSRVEQVLAGLQGYVLVDAKQHRIAKIDGTLFRDVEFGWGILGKLYQGGRFLVEQADVGDGQWEITHMRLSFQGRVLLIKKLAIESDEVFTGFRQVPSAISFAEGLKILETDSPCTLTQSEESSNRPH